MIFKTGRTLKATDIRRTNGQNIEVVDKFNNLFFLFSGNCRMEEQTEILAKSKGYNSTVAIDKCISVTSHIKVYVHWEVFMKKCVNLRLVME
jgi:hypothetical protein